MSARAKTAVSAQTIEKGAALHRNRRRSCKKQIMAHHVGSRIVRDLPAIIPLGLKIPKACRIGAIHNLAQFSTRRFPRGRSQSVYTGNRPMTQIHCPACAARYNVPDEKLGKRVKCVKCGEHFQLNAPNAGAKPRAGVGGSESAGMPAAATAETPQPAPAAPAAATEDDLFPDLPALQTGVAIAPIPLASNASSSDSARHNRSAAHAPTATGGPAQLATYLNDVFLGFARILAQPWELLTVVAVCIICLLKIPIGFGGLYGTVGSLIITGWYLSFLLKVVEAGANREDGLPDFSLADGIIEDVVLPCLSFLVVRLISILPLIAVLIYAVQDNRLDGMIAFTIGFMGVMTPEMALIMAFLLNSVHPNLAMIVVPPLLLGLAAVPMLVMVVSIAGIEALTRVDLMLTTVPRALPGKLH